MRQLAVSCCLLAACTSSRELRPDDVRVERILLASDFELARVSDGVWIHTTFTELPGGGPFPSNGLIIEGADGVVVVDTPWTPKATKTLLEWVETRLHKPVTDVIVTHSHDDRTAGVAELAPTTKIHALQKTVEFAAAQGRTFTAEPLQPTEQLTLGGVKLTTFFPGAGHAPDNIVVMLPTQRVLFGGCFIKSAAASDLGNVSDADIGAWAASLKRLTTWVAALEDKEVRSPLMVVPGHGGFGGLRLIAHTEEVVGQARR
ncbi:MAG: subclass B1 metallo-beta-lactamase [Archangiaceae bacterium]|nr:subclass B1 metallo-beta-lactamase [Archangiaceae bacterium]